jgi:hypothetical protein
MRRKRILRKRSTLLNMNRRGPCWYTRFVLVHRSLVEANITDLKQVSPQDSLPGVALRYGVALADLRRANKLWAADSIHLRRVLYIPLEKSSQLANLAPPSAADTTTDGVVSSSAPPPSTPEIRRVPASELSFFPPPSSSRSMLPAASMPNLPSYRSVSQTLPRPFRAPMTGATTPLSALFPSPAPTLSSLLQALPIPKPLNRAPPRRSFDSARSGSSPTSTTLSDQEHELADVSRRTSPERFSQRTPTPRPRRARVPEYSQDSPELQPTSVVRNQMAPQPAMQVPLPPPAISPKQTQPPLRTGLREVR